MTLHSRTFIRHDGISDAITRLVEDHADFFVTNGEGDWTFVAPYGRLDARLEDEGVAVELQAEQSLGLSYLRIFVAEHVSEYLGETPDIEWQGEKQITGRPPYLYEIFVVSTQRLGPHMQRVTFSAPEFDAIAAGPGLHIRLLLPPKGREAVWPVVAPSGAFIWPQGEDALCARVYTIRALDPVARTIDVDFVIHPTEGVSASNWSLSAQVGDKVALLGPGGDGVPQAPKLILGGDETAIPAIARILENLPEGAVAETVIEVEGPEDELPLPGKVEWLHRNGATTSGLPAAIRAREIDGDTYLWVGCEFAAFREIRRYARAERKIPRNRHLVVAYWRRGASGADDLEHVRD